MKNPGLAFKIRVGTALAVLALSMLATTGRAAADPPAPPANDAYLNSLQLNQPGSPLNRTDTLRDVRDTTSATTQSDIFDPPSSGGSAESTTCADVTYGATIWYDFHPDADGTMSVRTSGYDNVIALYPFSRATLEPNLDKKHCEHKGDFPSEQLVLPVKKGKAYTVQIGAVNGVGGSMEVLFDFAVKALKRLTASATLTAAAETNGIELRGLSVETSPKAKVTVNCGTHCRPQTKRHHATETFPSLSGVRMPAGSQLHIRVTAPKTIGVFIAYHVHRGSFTKVTRCLRPGSRKPRKKCR
jgi:hypothetical protein